MNSKYLRYIFGFLILGAILLSVVISKYALFAVSSLFIIFALKEYRLMFYSQNIYPHKYLPELISIICALVFITNTHQYITPVLTFGVFASFALTVIRNSKPYILTTFSSIAAFMLTFCALYMIKLFYLYSENNIEFILIYIAMVMSGDFCASLIGPHFKKYLLSPEISPNKTIAGAVANMIFSCLVSLFLIPVLKYNIWQCIFFAICVSFASQTGDLSVSTIKRNLKIKHSYDLFSEYGGILDRTDAFVFSAPAAYYAAIFIMWINNINF